MIRFILRALLGVPGWLGYFALMLPLILLGFPLVAVGALVMQYRQKYTGHSRSYFLHWPRWMWLWDNDEDGIDGDPWVTSDGEPKNPEWFEATANWSLWCRIFVWSAWRNSVGNARRTALFGTTVDPMEVLVSVPNSDQWLINGFRTWIPTWNERRKLGPYLARQRWRFELRFPWPARPQRDAGGDIIGGMYGPPRFFWIGWRIAQQDAVTKDIGFAFQPFGRL